VTHPTLAKELAQGGPLYFMPGQEPEPAADRADKEAAE